MGGGDPALDRTWLPRPVLPLTGPSLRRVGRRVPSPSRCREKGLESGAQSTVRGQSCSTVASSPRQEPRRRRQPRRWPGDGQRQRWAGRTRRRTRREGGRRREASPVLWATAPVATTPWPVGPGAGVAVCAPGSTPDTHHPAHSCAVLTGAPGSPPAPSQRAEGLLQATPPHVPWPCPVRRGGTRLNSAGAPRGHSPSPATSMLTWAISERGFSRQPMRNYTLFFV